MPHRLTIMAASVCLVCVIAGVLFKGTAGATDQKTTRSNSALTLVHAHRARIQRVNLKKAIDFYVGATHKWQFEALRPMTRTSHLERRTHSTRLLRWIARLWQKRAKAARKAAQDVPHMAAWECIHGYEGAWTDNTGNGYYGGLQMDLAFMRDYAPKLLKEKGTANHWTPLEQMHAAERAFGSGRGFGPWRVTAHDCGLL